MQPEESFFLFAVHDCPGIFSCVKPSPSETFHYAMQFLCKIYSPS